MSDKIATQRATETSRQAQEQQDAFRNRLNGSHHPPSNGQVMERVQAVQQMNQWLTEQRDRFKTMGVMFLEPEAHKVLYAAEQTWQTFQLNGTLQALPNIPTQPYTSEEAGIALPTELASSIRYFIRLTEPEGPQTTESSSNGIDWNTRLGISEYRTQSDNLVAPEATCNVTTLAMVFERLGYGRDDVLMALEKRMGLNTLSTEETREMEWKDHALDYINDNMRASGAYRRVRGEGWLSTDDKNSMASDFRDQAQLEDLLDLLADELGMSRYSVISEPERMLQAVTQTGQDTPTAEKIWDSSWSKTTPKITECLENGGAVALSFYHKGNRGNGTHIVSVLEVRGDELIIDDPYGDIREDYSRRRYDDAYWSQNDDDNLIYSRDRSNQRNVIGDTDDWGIDWARERNDEDVRGRESTMDKTQFEGAMFYVQLFHRAQPSPYAPTSSRRPTPRSNARIE